MIRELLPPETGLAFAAMQALRSDLSDEAAFVQQVDEVQRPEGYRLYVDDLSTLPAARQRGHARGLLDWLLAEAGRLGCGQIHLDSGVGIDRADAHRLYLNAGMVIVAHHFARYAR